MRSMGLRHSARETAISLPKFSAPSDSDPEVQVIFEVDAQGRCTGTWSGDIAALRQLAGMRPPEPLQALSDCLDAGLVQHAHEVVTGCMHSGQTTRVVVERRCGDAVRFVSLTAAPRWHAGVAAPEACTLTIRDASVRRARKRMLDILAQACMRTSNLVVATDARGRIEWVNEAFTRVTGYTLEEARGCSPGELLQFEGTDAGTVARIGRALAARQPVQAEILNRAKDGREYWLWLDIQPVLGGEGQLEGFVAVQADITEDRRHSRRLEELAQEAEEARSTLLAAVDALPDGFALYDTRGCLMHYNAAYAALHPGSEAVLRSGISLETLLRHEVESGLITEARGRESEWVEQTIGAIQRSSSWRGELELPDGRWVRSVKLRTPGGNLIALRSDITGLKIAEKRAVAQRLAAMDASNDGIAMTDAQGQLLYMNPAWAAMFGARSSEGWIGRPWTHLCHPADRPALEAAVLLALGAHGVWRGLVRGERLDGTSFDQELSLARAPGDTLVLNSRDVSERLHHEAERRRLQDTVIRERVEHEARLQGALVETKRLQERERQMREASEMVVRALSSLSEAPDPADGPLHLLRQLSQTLGAGCAALLPLEPGQDLLCLGHPDWWREVSSQVGLTSYLASRPHRLIGDLTVVQPLAELGASWPEGPLRWMATARMGRAHAEYLLVAAGTSDAGLDLGRAQRFLRFAPLLPEALRRRDDARRARALERDLEQARKMESLGVLASGIAHEINTPMQYIGDNLHFLKRAFEAVETALTFSDVRSDASVPDDAELSYLLTEVPLALEQSLEGSRRVAEIVEAVRLFAYPELTQEEEIDLQALLGQCLVITRSGWKHDVDLALQVTQQVPAVRGASGPISQVFVNLITNACDAARLGIGTAGATVRLSLHAADGAVLVHVDDNGPGVPQSLRERIFDPFFTTKPVGEGTGQGLAICRSIVERHGASMTLEDSPLGGARFTVRFPLIGAIAR